jgi:hypothetical protein
MIFHEFRSTTFIGDGLRYLPALRTITEGPPATFQPKPWLEVYRSHYEPAVVHHHFLFGLTMRTAFALQQALGIYGDATIAIQAVNSLAAAIAGGLFFLLVHRLGVPKGISFAVAVGVCLSPAYLLAATNVAEVALALRFFVRTLLVLADRDSLEHGAIATAILAALAAITYLLAGALVPCIAIAAIISRSPSESTVRKLVLFVSVFALIFLGIWVGVLYVSGVHSASNLAIAILKFPEQGTYGQFKLGSLVATPVGLTTHFFRFFRMSKLSLVSARAHPECNTLVCSADVSAGGGRVHVVGPVSPETATFWSYFILGDCCSRFCWQPERSNVSLAFTTFRDRRRGRRRENTGKQYSTQPDK